MVIATSLGFSSRLCEGKELTTPHIQYGVHLLEESVDVLPTRLIF